MKQLTAFIHKELLESLRTGKVAILLILFILLGILNPAIARLTPWLLSAISDSMSETGLSVAAIEVNALTSWAQFYKNIPIALIVFLLAFSGTLTNEYQKGTLIPMITKGMARWKIVAAKGAAIAAYWTIGYWLCYGITYGYNAYFWGNGNAPGLFFSALGFYLIGLWLVSLILTLSAIAGSGSFVMLGVGGIFLIVYLLGLLPAAGEYLPVRLLHTSNLPVGAGRISDYAAAIAVTLLWTAVNAIAAAFLFDRKKI
ncbi:ABC transporter permease [Saccharibacillus sp. CPCC 101409]|uniref:ABC transporter permease subunit n=1 Tax=Saccharibacillus sp. CPCC 101409 TaxID=3058041 RepID=UPI00267177C1|nr:ABC transporter permease subunit [Saccharibacillus sp. CPCC 101409]MDO3410342.1 ABC transporter permease [Saccharibacillus sp. CPCC 101409]